MQLPLDTSDGPSPFQESPLTFFPALTIMCEQIPLDSQRLPS